MNRQYSKHSKFNKLENSLALFYDEENVLHSNIRTDKHSELNFETKNLPFLRNSSDYTKMVILRSPDSSI